MWHARARAHAHKARAQGRTLLHYFCRYLGLCPSGQFGEKHTLFEPCHGSAPDIAGKGEVNPLSQVLSGAMMLQHLGEHDAADRIFAAVESVLRMGGGNVTGDLGGTASTQQMTAAIVKALA